MATSTELRSRRAISTSTTALGPLTSSRLLLRSYTPDDAEPVFDAIEETRLSLLRWVPDIGSRSTVLEVRSGLTSLITAAANHRKHIVFGIWEPSSERFLGEVGLYSVDLQRGVGELGYWLRQGARGNGYVSEAARMLVAYARSTVRLRRIEAHVAAENLPSRRVVERLGFVVASHRRPAPQWDGTVGDVLIYALPARHLREPSGISKGRRVFGFAPRHAGAATGRHPARPPAPICPTARVA